MWWTVKSLFKLIVVLLILIYVALLFQPVQDWVGNQFANVLSKAWDTKVTIRAVDITPLTDFTFHDVYIEDHAGDTVIYAASVKAEGYNVFSLFNKTIDIETATMENVVCKLQRLPEQKDFNFKFIIDFFEGDGKAKKNEKFKFSLSGARISNVRFHFFDAAVGTALTANVQKGHVDAYDVDMIGKRVWGDTACLENSKVFLHIFEPVPIPGIDSSWWDPVPVDSNSTIPNWNLWSKRVQIKNLDYRLLNNRIGVDTTRKLDFSDLHLDDINMRVDSFCMHNEGFSGWLRHLNGTDHRGFAIKSMKGHVIVNQKELAITKFRLETSNSSLGDSLVFKYNGFRSFQTFVDSVSMYANFKKCNFTFSDIAAFAPNILDNKFIGANQDKSIRVNGQFKGKINDFRAKNLDIRVAKNTRIVGNISMNDVTIPDAAFMDLSLKQVQSTYSDLKSILPFVDLPPILNRLGLMRFQGTYTGFFQDFVAFGELNTDIGTINSDLKLNLRGGATRASYEGGVQLTNFDIGKLIEQEEVGKISLQTKVRGKGLTLESLDATLDNARVDYFVFKGYKYEDIKIDGSFNQKRFNGDVISKDDNIDFILNGIIDLNEEIPMVNITGKIDSINFDAINLTNENITLSIDTFLMDAIGNNLDNFDGQLYLKNIAGSRGETYSSLDYIWLEAHDTKGDLIRYETDSTPIYESSREIVLQSDVMSANVNGDFKLIHLARSIEQFLRRNHPNLFKNLNYTADSTILSPVDSLLSPIELAEELNTQSSTFVPHQDFSLNLKINDSKNLTQLISPEFKSLEGVLISGLYDGTDEELILEGELEKVHVGNAQFNNIVLEGDAVRNKFDLKTKIASLELNDTTFLPRTTVSLDAIGDSVLFAVSTSSIGNVASDIAIKGQLEVKENTATLRLDTSNLQILGLDWSINDDNYIKIGDKQLDVHNIRLTNGNKMIAVSSFQEKGMRARLENIDLGWLYKMGQPLPQINVEGSFSADASIGNIFTQKDINATVYFDTLIINKDYWGSNSKLVVKGDSLKSTFKGRFTHNSDFVDSLQIDANFTPTIATKDKNKQNLLEIEAQMIRAKAKIIEYFLTDQISKTEGLATAKAKIYGNIRGKQTVMNISGNGEMTGVKTTVNMLNTRYALEDGKLVIDNKGFHIRPRLKLDRGEKYESGGVALVEVSEPDKKGYIGGSLTHTNLKNFGLDIIAYFENNLVMNTQKGDNAAFYGKVYATGTANFKGPFEKLKLTVDAYSEPNSELVLPLGDPLEVAEVNYINFVDKTKEESDSNQLSIKEQVWGGLDIEINARVSPNIKMKLIFDEKAGDVMQGTGFGNLTIKYSSVGDLKIFGDYTIEEGSYLFTFKNLLNKPFKVKKGGTIVWGDNDGDPYKARLNIQAVYEKNLALTNLLAPYTATNPNLATLASKSTEVDILMNLKGELFSPDISFDIQIDDVDSRLRSYVDLVLRTIRADNSELNRQVFGVITLQQFLPVENGQNINALSTGVSTGISTLSELLSQQLSLYVNDLLASAIEDVDGISDLKLDLNFNYQGDGVATIDDNTTSNVRVGGDLGFLDNRLRVYAGANVDINNNNNLNTNTNTQSNLGYDIVVEYYITPDGQLKLSAYRRTETTILGPSERTGVGIAYQKEFDKISFKSNRTEQIKNRIQKLNAKIKRQEVEVANADTPKEKRKLELKLQKSNEKLDREQNRLALHLQKVQARKSKKNKKK